MRPLSRVAIGLFFGGIVLFGSIGFLASRATHSITIGIGVFVLLHILLYRIALLLFSSRTQVDPTRAQSLHYFDILVLYDVYLWIPLLHSGVLPLLLSTSLYRVAGVQLGHNSYPATALICNPYHFVKVGDNVIFGSHAVITPHTYEGGQKLTILPIRIGNDVTIGINSVIMPGVIIEEGAVIAAGAVVTKNTHIKKGEVWAGVPARKIERV